MAGDNSTSNESGRALIEHWNGTRWSLARSPNPGPGFSQLSGVVALSSTDVWAVGGREGDTLIEHWNGTTWSIVASPNGQRTESELYGLAATGPSDIWAVGESSGSNGSDPLVLHWDGTAWTAVAAMNGSLPFTSLVGLSALSPTDIWAVGYTDNPITVKYRTVTEHWDGTAWTIVASPNPGEYNTLSGVALTRDLREWCGNGAGLRMVGFAPEGLSSTEDGRGPMRSPRRSLLAFAVGLVAVTTQPLGAVERGQCPQPWAVVETPSMGDQPNWLTDVDALATDDAWAVGMFSSLGYTRILTLHWDGGAWTTVPAFDYHYWNQLYSVEAVSSDEVWGVGQHGPGGPSSRTLVERWDGQRWGVVPSPTATQFVNSLLSVTSVANDDLWAAGLSYGLQRPSLYAGTLTEHWDGSEWSIVSSPNAGRGSNFLRGIAGTGPNDVWAVGSYTPDPAFGYTQTLTMHWDGAAWAIVPSPSPGDYLNDLFAVDAVAPDDVWAAGTYTTLDEGAFGLILHWDGASWIVAPMNDRPGDLRAITELGADRLLSVGIGDHGSLTAVGGSDGWSRIPSPNGESGSAILLGASSEPGGAWAVGADGAKTFAIRHCGSSSSGSG